MGRIILTDQPADTRPRATGTGIGAANDSPVRVTVTQPDRVEKNRLTGTARRKVVLDCVGLSLNSNYVEAALSNAADYRGPVTPYPATEDAKWNEEIQPWLNRTFLKNAAWDASGNFSFADFQRQMWRYRDLEGDCFLVETYEEPDNKLSRPVTRLIPSLMCDSPMFGRNPDWIDGVKVGLHHRATDYHFLYEETAARFANVGARAGFTVPRASVVHFARRATIGGSRGVTRFLTSSKDVVNTAMMDSALHSLFNLAAKMGVTITQDKDGSPAVMKPREGVFTDDTVASDAVASDADDEDGVVDIVRVKEEFVGQGTTIVNLTDTPGQKMEWKNFRDTLPDVTAVHACDLESMAMPWGLPVQVLFCIFSGVFNATGPGFRIAISRASRWRAEELALIEPIIRRAYARQIAWGIATGQIRRPKGVLDPAKSETRWVPDLTIDLGRDIKADMERLQMGVTDEFELAAAWGRDALQVIDKRTEFINAVCEKLGDRKQFWGPNFKEARPDPREAPPPKAAA